jgi:excinuclease UvrABC helicase subunit UvrB
MISKKKKKIPLEFNPNRNVVVSEGIIRPTGLIDPNIIIKPVENQVDDVLEQVRIRVSKGQRVLITTLTKKFAQELDLYFKQISVKSAYIHSDVETLDRIDILSDLRRGKYDVLIGINLLREGLDLPEVSLVAVFDADKEGFLRSRTSLIQIIGRAARHVEGTVILYADRMTNSMNEAIAETNRRRAIQTEYNTKHGITPKSTKRELKSIADEVRENKISEEEVENEFSSYKKPKVILTHTGFVEVNSLDEIDLSSRHSNQNQEKSNSIHGEKRMKRQRDHSKQIYSTFDIEKQAYIKEFTTNKLNESELKERLQIAIDGLNFEEAAAIRDMLNNN